MEGIMTADQHVEFQLGQSCSGTQVTTRSIANAKHDVTQLASVIDGISLNKQMLFLGQFSSDLIEFTAWWQAVDLHELKITIEQDIIRFRYPMMHLVSHISESIL
jgi:hypothetical protein